MKIEDRAYPIFVHGVRILSRADEEILCANGHMACLATTEMIERGLVPEGSAEIMAPRKWFCPAKGAPDDWLDSSFHGS